jgi:hypothetical protein
MVRDDQANGAAVKMDKTIITRKEALSVELRAGGGFVARFTK